MASISVLPLGLVVEVTDFVDAHRESFLRLLHQWIQADVFFFANKPARGMPAVPQGALPAMGGRYHVPKRPRPLLGLGGMECRFVGKLWFDGTFVRSKGGEEYQVHPLSRSDGGIVAKRGGSDALQTMFEQKVDGVAPDAMVCLTAEPAKRVSS